MSVVRSKTKTTGRKASKEVRRRQLIDATIAVLARRGYADLTLADVADEAGLSRGIVNFHFESKDKLLTETLRSMAETYRRHWQSAIDRAGARPAEQLWSLIAADFDRAVCNRRMIAAWSVLRAEGKSRPIYRAICGEHDEAFGSVLQSLIAEIDAAGRDAQRLALGLDSLLEGLWLQHLMQPSNLSRLEAHACAIEHLVGLFPDVFHHGGPLRPQKSSVLA